jgi:hypothetical protein
MKRFLAAGLFLFCTASAFAEVSLGVDLSTNWNNDHQQLNQNNDQGTVRYTFNAGPRVLIVIGEKVEVAPFVDLSYSRTSYYVNGDLRTLDRSWGYDAGCGVYFRLINGEVFRFSIGPRLLYGMNFDPENTDFTQNLWYLSAPANIDFRLSDRFFVRASPVIAGVGYTLNSTGQQDAYSGNFYFRVITQSALSIGFFFTF